MIDKIKEYRPDKEIHATTITKHIEAGNKIHRDYKKAPSASTTSKRGRPSGGLRIFCFQRV